MTLSASARDPLSRPTSGRVRAFGLGVFACLFGLLAWRAHALPGIWELAIAYKAALTLAAASATDAVGASTVLVADGSPTMSLVVAYALLRGHLT